MGFNEVVIHDLLVLEDASIKAESDIKKLKRVNMLQWVVIGYLLCTNHKNIDKEVTIEDKVKEKCKKMFDRKRDK